jgi:hypothetical protein
MLSMRQSTKRPPKDRQNYYRIRVATSSYRGDGRPFGRLIRNAMTFEPYLHWTFHDEHVLFSKIVLNSPLKFLLACLLIILICLLERLNISFIHSFFFFFTNKFYYNKVFNLLPGQKLVTSSIQVKAFVDMSCFLENRAVFNCNVPAIVSFILFYFVYLGGRRIEQFHLFHLADAMCLLQ